MLHALQVDSLTGKPRSNTAKLKERGRLPFKLRGYEYSALQAYCLNVQGELCDRFAIRPDLSRDVLIKAAPEFLAKWADITQTPHTLLAVFARMKEGTFLQWTVRVINKRELRKIAATERWDCSWNIDLHEVFNAMLVRAEAHGIPLPDRTAPIEEWNKEAV